MSSTEHGSDLTFGSYLHHHLTQWTVGADEGFWRFNVDSIIVSLVIGSLLCYFLYSQAKKATPGVPGKFLVAIEMFIAFVNDMTGNFIQGGGKKFFAPLAGFTFLWILAMNIIDFIPVDWIPQFASVITGNDAQLFRPLPTADANVTTGIDIGIFTVVILAGFKSKGMNYYRNFVFHPLPGGWLTAPVNLFLEVVGIFAEFLSLSLRLFGNMFAGEVIYVLIAAMFSLGLIASLGAISISFAWSLLHILVVTLQAYIFMTLSLLYISKSWNKEEH